MKQTPLTLVSGHLDWISLLTFMPRRCAALAVSMRKLSVGKGYECQLTERRSGGWQPGLTTPLTRYSPRRASRPAAGSGWGGATTTAYACSSSLADSPAPPQVGRAALAPVGAPYERFQPS